MKSTLVLVYAKVEVDVSREVPTSTRSRVVFINEINARVIECGQRKRFVRGVR